MCYNPQWVEQNGSLTRVLKSTVSGTEWATDPCVTIHSEWNRISHWPVCYNPQCVEQNESLTGVLQSTVSGTELATDPCVTIHSEWNRMSHWPVCYNPQWVEQNEPLTRVLQSTVSGQNESLTRVLHSTVSSFQYIMYNYACYEKYFNNERYNWKTIDALNKVLIWLKLGNRIVPSCKSVYWALCDQYQMQMLEATKSG